MINTAGGIPEIPARIDGLPAEEREEMLAPHRFFAGMSGDSSDDEITVRRDGQAEGRPGAAKAAQRLGQPLFALHSPTQ